MAFKGFKREEKNADLVWVLNLFPPFLGLGTIYAIGPKAIIFVLAALYYLNLEKFSPSSMAAAYVFLSIVGMLGAFFHNVKLDMGRVTKAPDSKDFVGLSIVRSDAEEKEPTESYALDCFERKLQEAEKMLEGKRPEFRIVDAIESDTVLKISRVDSAKSQFDSVAQSNRLDSPEKHPLANLFPEEELKELSLPDLEPVSNLVAPEPELESKAKAKAKAKEVLFEPGDTVIFEPGEKSLAEETDQIAAVGNDFSSPQALSQEIESLESACQPKTPGTLEKEEKEEIDRVISRLGAATGEFQPVAAPLDSLPELGGYNFSTDFGEFKFESSGFGETEFEKNFETAMTASTARSKTDAKCGECGAEVDSSFAFCLKCGKVF